jgi:hypothetical protein
MAQAARSGGHAAACARLEVMMAKWRLTADCYLAPVGEVLRVCREGEIIDHPGPPALSMEPEDGEARAILAEQERRTAARCEAPVLVQ